MTEVTRDLLKWNAGQVLLGNKNNMLLTRDAVGKAKPSTRILPDHQFAFGKPELFEDRETVAKGKLSYQKCPCVYLITYTYSNSELAVP